MNPNTSNCLLVSLCGSCREEVSELSQIISKNLAKEHATFHFIDHVQKNKIPIVFSRDNRIATNYDYKNIGLYTAKASFLDIEQDVIPALKKYDVVLCDGYYFSCLAYLKAREIYDTSWAFEIGKTIIKPDLCFFVDIPAHFFFSKNQHLPNPPQRETDFYERLRESYIDLCYANKGILIDGTTPFSALQKEIIKKIKENIKRGD
jgi:thymidylate kinase